MYEFGEEFFIKKGSARTSTNAAVHKEVIGSGCLLKSDAPFISVIIKAALITETDIPVKITNRTIHISSNKNLKTP